MTFRQTHLLFVIVLIGAISLVAPTALTQESVDFDAVYRIKEEGLKRSEIQEVLSYLTDIHGPRLTNSLQIRVAAEWATKRLGEWNLDNIRQETWGPFGRGWSNERLIAHVVSPTPYPLSAYPRAWTPGTEGSITAEAVLAVITNESEISQWKGKLKDKIVLTVPAPVVKPHFAPRGRRFTDAELAALEEQKVSASPRAYRTPNKFAQRRMEFFVQEGVVAVLQPGRGRGDHGSIHVTGPSQQRHVDASAVPLQLVVASEHYGRLVRTLNHQVPVPIELDVQNHFYDDNLDSFNLLADIPGTDKADELVLIGAHFDSWHAGTGATDNAAGVAAVMEAMRILKATGLAMRRTVRLALWTGEEPGFLGSRAYVREHFADRETMTRTAAHEKVSVYFNLDNGSGAIRGVYLQGNEAVRPIFNAWIDPLRSMGMTTLTIRGTGATDHVSFDEVGLPGFQFTQDPLEYSTHSHHTNMDLYERVQLDDLMKNAVILASFVYHAANRDELLPRKPLPNPRVDRAVNK